MIDVQVTIVKDTATPALRALREGLDNDAVIPIFARSVANAVRANYDDLEANRPNKLGGQRQHYYSGAESATHYRIEGDYAIVSVAQRGMRMRYYGGTINAGVNPSYLTGEPTKFLTIPATAEAYGHRAADFPDLTVLWGKNGPYALARVQEKMLATARSSGNQTQNTEVLYWLRPSVDIPADQSMLPSSDQITEEVTRDFYAYVKMLWARRAA